ncbi:MAG: hypothetical protein AB1384_09785 [Actinomycetota bacterium]
MSAKKGLLALAAALLAILTVSVPLQYLVRQEVVVGLASDEAHSHAHEEEEHSHVEEGTEEGGEGQVEAQEHT